MNRYDVTCASDLWLHPDGDYIRYADHAALIAQVREVAEKLQSVNDPESYEYELGGKLLALCEKVK